jgi:hypothetical protein
MRNAMILGSGLCWTLAYLLIIRQSFVDRTYGMPLVALGANLSWEFIFSVLRPPAMEIQHLVNIVWLCFDLVILVAVVRFGSRQFNYLPKHVFYCGLAGILTTCYLGVDLVSRELDNGEPYYAAFGQNLLMSGLFLSMLAARRSLAGQSASIAALKLVGTACAVVWISSTSQLLIFVYVAILVVDLAYLAAVVMVGRAARSGAVSGADLEISGESLVAA